MLAEARAAEAAGRAATASHGIDDWRALIKRSAVDFSPWRLARPASAFDVHDELYRDVVREEFKETLAAGDQRAA